MKTIHGSIASTLPAAKPDAGPSEVRNRIRGLLANLYPGGHVVERRTESRYPYPHLVRLTPVGPDNQSTTGPAVVVAGKQISENGLGFFHRDPLPNRRMIATLETGDGRKIRLLIDITWCRFTRQGWYESGGRFLQSLGGLD